MKSTSTESVARHREIFFQMDQLTAERLSPSDLDLVISLNHACHEFFLLQNGSPPTEAEARELFESPTHCPGATKLPIGLFYQSTQLAGVIDILRGYRTASDWYIGLMLLNPDFQGRGFGSEIHNELVTYARQQGVQRLLIAVLEVNEPARRFWLRLGYRKVKDFPPRQFGNRFHELTEFEMTLPQSG